MELLARQSVGLQVTAQAAAEGVATAEPDAALLPIRYGGAEVFAAQVPQLDGRPEV